MTGGGIQIPLGDLPLNPHEVALLNAPERGRLYVALGLHPVQIEAAEAAVRRVIARRYGKVAGG